MIRDHFRRAIALALLGPFARYRLSGRCYLTPRGEGLDRLVEPFHIVKGKLVRTVIGWSGVPNESMHPVNGAARILVWMLVRAVSLPRERVRTEEGVAARAIGVDLPRSPAPIVRHQPATEDVRRRLAVLYDHPSSLRSA